MKHRIITLALIALGALAGVAAHAEDILKIGSVGPLSGDGAAWGQALLHGAELAADDVNAQGGLDVGGKKYKVQVIAYDDKYQADAAVTAFTRLVSDDHVKYVIGPVGSASALAIEPITERNKVIILTLAYVPTAIGKDKLHAFRSGVTNGESGPPMIDWFVKARNVRKVGGLFTNDETGQQAARDLEAGYSRAGAQLSAKEFFERGRVDMLPLLTRILATGVDTIDLNSATPGDSGLIVRQARELGFKGMIVRSGGPATSQIVAVAGKAATEGMLVFKPIDPDDQAVQDYAARHLKKYGKPMNDWSPAFYDGTHMLFKAMQQAGTVTDSEQVARALASIKDHHGLQGTINWTGEAKYGINHQINAPFYIAEVKDGKEVVRARCTLLGCQ